MTGSAAANAPLSFEEAIARAQAWLARWDDAADAFGATDLAREAATAIATPAGARGFFVAFLTGESTAADRPDDALLAVLRAAPDPVPELLVKNLAMATAVAIAHRRDGNEALARGSDRVARRSRHLLAVLDSERVWAIARQLRASALGDSDAYANFLQKWHYDAEQRTAIATALQPGR